jgi:copper chaperone
MSFLHSNSVPHLGWGKVVLYSTLDLKWRAGMMVRTYSVPGISCDHCKRAIEGELATLEGVGAVTVDVSARTVRVEGDASDEAVRAAIDEAGYEVASVAS